MLPSAEIDEESACIKVIPSKIIIKSDDMKLKEIQANNRTDMVLIDS
jgi:hypothetical protein